MKKFFSIITSVALLLSVQACQLKIWDDNSADGSGTEVTVARYDRLQSRYLTTGDFSALQSMNISYPMETRTLVENVRQLGTVDMPDINERLLKFYQDTTLQTIIAEAETQYADMDDINKELSEAFGQLRKHIPDFPIPVVYTQIGALTQSIIVGDGIVGVCLDKYLGKDFPVYDRYYLEYQKETMTREHLVPDCLTFYILSLYPMENFDNSTQVMRDRHIAKMMWVVNKVTGKNTFDTPELRRIDQYMKSNPKVTISQLLTMREE